MDARSAPRPGRCAEAVGAGRHSALLALVCCAGLLAAACGGGQATLAPTPGNGTQEVTTMPDGSFTLTSTAFEEGGSIPRRHTCDGDDVSPELQWSGAPDGTGALVLLMDDPDARGFVHWLVLDVSATASGGLPDGFSSSPDAPRQGTNSFGSIGYRGPCPPSGTHRYVFTLFAVSEPLNLPGQPDADAARRAMEGSILGQATLTATYTRGG